MHIDDIFHGYIEALVFYAESQDVVPSFSAQVLSQALADCKALETAVGWELDAACAWHECGASGLGFDFCLIRSGLAPDDMGLLGSIDAFARSVGAPRI